MVPVESTPAMVPADTSQAYDADTATAQTEDDYEKIVCSRS